MEGILTSFLQEIKVRWATKEYKDCTPYDFGNMNSATPLLPLGKTVRDLNSRANLRSDHSRFAWSDRHSGDLRNPEKATELPGNLADMVHKLHPSPFTVGSFLQVALNESCTSLTSNIDCIVIKVVV